MTYKECEQNLKKIVMNLPEPYPPNNQLRREHKPMVSKKMRKKRERERYDYFRRNYKDILELIEESINEFIPSTMDRFFDNFASVEELAFEYFKPSEDVSLNLRHKLIKMYLMKRGDNQ